MTNIREKEKIPNPLQKCFCLWNLIFYTSPDWCCMQNIFFNRRSATLHRIIWHWECIFSQSFTGVRQGFVGIISYSVTRKKTPEIALCKTSFTGCKVHFKARKWGSSKQSHRRSRGQLKERVRLVYAFVYSQYARLQNVQTPPWLCSWKCFAGTQKSDVNV